MSLFSSSNAQTRADLSSHTGARLQQIHCLLSAASADRAARENAADGLAAVLDTQDPDPASPTFGQMPLHLPGRCGDLNAALFLLPDLLRFETQRQMLPPSLAARLIAAIEAMITAAERRWDEEVFDIHRDGLGYTNIALIHMRALALGANFRKDDRLMRRALAFWRRWLHHVAHFGFDEFLSPTYTHVALDALADLRALFRDVTVHREIARLQACIASMCRAVTHPLLDVPVCGMSRCYRRSFRDGAPPTWKPDLERLALPEQQEHAYPRRASGRATAVPFRWSSFQQPRWGLGSFTGGHYFWQQIQLVAAAGSSAQDRDLCWLPAEPTTTLGFVAQRDGAALCLFSRTVATLHRTQWAARGASPRELAGSYGLAVAGRWRLCADRPGYRLDSPAGPTLRLQPFVLDGETVKPCVLDARRPLPSLHALPGNAASHIAYLFPEEPEQFGLLVSFASLPDGLPTHRIAANRHTLQMAEFSLAWTVMPDGRMVEHYDDDWRTAPLFESAELTVYPGDLLQSAERKCP